VTTDGQQALSAFREQAEKELLETKHDAWAGVDVLEIGLPFQDRTAWSYVFLVDGFCVAGVPGVDSVPDGPEAEITLRIIAGINYRESLFRFGVDPQDGEVRALVVVPTSGEPDAVMARVVIEALREALAAYERAAAAVKAALADVG
jgi:hypothetical protein